MSKSVRIGAGSRVEGSYGPLITNPNASIKRRIRSKAIGTVIKAAGPHKWEVVFDFDAKVKTVSSRSLTVVQADAGIPLDKEGTLVFAPNVSIESCAFSSWCRTISLLIGCSIEYSCERFDNNIGGYYINCSIVRRRRYIQLRCC